MTLSFGVHAGPHDVSIQSLRAFWQQMEEWGTDWLSVGDHFYPTPPLALSNPQYEAVSLLTALAAETSRARIGCLVFAAPYRNPGNLAKALTTIDHLSDGRLEVGLGAGWHRPEFESFGYAFRSAGERLDHLEEAIQVISRLLRHERTTFEGRYVRVHDAICEPPPIQKRVPIWIGGTGEKRTLRIAARHADVWNANGVTASEFRRLNRILDQWCRAQGRDPESIQRSVNLVFGLTRSSRSSTATSISQPGLLVGTPDQAEAAVTEYIKAGAQRINVRVRTPWDHEALEAYMREVVPSLRSSLA